jgi:hypothetical protein
LCALAKVPLEDDFRTRLLSLKGIVQRDVGHFGAVYQILPEGRLLFHEPVA